MSIEKIKDGDGLSMSEDILKSNIEKLKELFPELVTESKIDFNAFKTVFGDEVEEEDEYYRFTWAGKAQARREAHKPSTGTLRPAKNESVDWDTTQNLYIEGDNLEVLKLMQKSYAGKVKMIYIDPPYNTGKDFVYKDNYKDNLKNYQQITGQVDDEGNKLTTNSESEGRYHSNWLNMMYPRLRLARNLLKDDGVIFISIDDNEVENLKKIGNEIFGEDNFIANIIWEKKFAPSNDAKWLSDNHDHILIWSRNKKNWRPNLLKRNEKALSRYKNPDSDHRGVWVSGDITVKTYSAKYDFPITTPSGKVINPPEGICWRFSQDKVNQLIDENRIWFGKDGGNVPRLKRFLTDVKDGVTPMTIWYHKDVGHNQEAYQECRKIFDGKQFFSTPKPIRLLKRILHIGSSDDDLIVDFFSGSSSTAHAVMELNAEDSANRKHIQVQLPELLENKNDAIKEGYKNITEIGKERIRIAAKKIAKENPDKSKELDLGFKVFKLDSSNIKGWDGNPDNLEESLFDAVSNIKNDRTEEDVLYEILLKYGLDLTLPIEEKKIEGVTVFNVGLGALFICLADTITSKVAEGIGKWKEELNPEVCRVVFKDTGFTDVEKTNSVQTLKRFGITEIKSI